MVKALDDVSLSIEQGEFVAIIGTSGSGKSTLLNMLGGLDHPTSGSVRVDYFELGKLGDEDLTVFRRQRIGFIFQNYNLVPILNVYENIVMPIQLNQKKPDQAFVERGVALLGLEKKLDDMPNNLSGGQQQRVAIARALASKPAIILADEPTGNLDSKTSDEVIELLKMTGNRFGQTIVMTTLMFTSLFVLSHSLSKNLLLMSFRQSGYDAEVSFKTITEQQAGCLRPMTKSLWIP